jgi:predicted ATPase
LQIMRLIQSIQIEGVRSIQTANLASLSGLTTFVGKNSSGKSNLLRALNLFFNNELEPGRPLDFARDVYDEVPRLKKKKKIVVSVDFLVPPNFRFRKELEAVKALGDSFSIRRQWEIDPRRLVKETTELTVNGSSVANGSELARQFLSLVTFRYIPNRSVPARLLREESQTIANAIFRRMRGGNQGAELMQALNDAANKLLQDAATNFANSGSPLTSPSVATAESIGQMLQMSGFQAIGQHGGIVRDEDWGSGHQAFFLYELLRAVDTDISQSFGWRQAAVWGVEEPESALHRDLETRLADEMRSWVLDEDSRLQVLQTTHSPVLTMAAESGFWVELSNKRTVFQPLLIPELTRAAEAKGVSGWVHPVLSFPWNPVVLVEGDIDASVLTHVANVGGLSTFRFLPLPTLDPSEKGGGKDQLIKYIRGHQQLIQNRPPLAPLVVLFDWEVADAKIAQAREAYGRGGDRYVFRMDASLCHQQMGSTFRGIERFYPPRIVLEAHDADEMVVGIKQGRPYSVAASELARGKLRLMDRLLKTDNLNELLPLIRTLMEIDQRVRGKLVPQLTLPGIP